MNIVPATRLQNDLNDLYKALMSPVRDGRVACPSYDWLAGPFADFVRDNVRTYVPEKFDCDDFALKAVVLATEALNASDEITGCGHSIGICYLHVAGNLNGVTDANHATNIVRLDDGRLMFFEPQNRGIMDAREAVAAGLAKPYFYLL